MLKTFFKKTKGFTLVEIMVVVAIIGILSTLIVISLDTTKMTARNTRRLADIKQLQIALKMYYADNGFYPTAITGGASLARNGVNYLLRVPQNPLPYNDNGCTNPDYQYKQLEGGQRYSLTFCLGDKTDDLSAGSKTATANGILDCPTGYIAVPGSATFETNDFCVMKYEAKCAKVSSPDTGETSPVTALTGTYDNSVSASACSGTYNPLTGAYTGTYVPVSTMSGYAIGNITQATAKTYCQNIGAHLITNAEWMTIARSIEQVPSNWFSGVVGTDYISIGNYNATTAMDGNSTYGSAGSTHIYKRNLTLLSGEVIKDFSGNVAEWVDDTCTSGSGIGKYFYGGSSYYDWSDATPNLVADYERGASGPSNALWGISQGLGTYKPCTTGNPFLRGGSVADGGHSGIFGLQLNNIPASSNPLWGFRCVR